MGERWPMEGHWLETACRLGQGEGTLTTSHHPRSPNKAQEGFPQPSWLRGGQGEENTYRWQDRHFFFKKSITRNYSRKKMQYSFPLESISEHLWRNSSMSHWERKKES